MLVRRCMTQDVVTMDAEATLVEASECLQRFGFRHIPVMQHGKLAGIVSDRDLLAPKPGAATVGEVMTPEPVVISPRAAVDEAAQTMRARRIDALPVVDGGQLAGIITSSDVLEAFVDLSGVRGPTYLVMLRTRTPGNAEVLIQKIVGSHHGHVKWLHCEEQFDPARIQLRMMGRNIDDILTALEAAGFEVTGLVGNARAALRGFAA